MKLKMKHLALIAIAVTGLHAAAEPHVPAGPMPIDFNQMIEQNAADQSELRSQITEATHGQEAAEVAKAPADDRRKVIDFIDMEVGVGDDAHVVDRR